MRSVRRLVILHVALGIASVIAYWQRPDGFLSHAHVRGREIALFAILKVFLAWIPYFVSAYYSTSVLPEHSPRATTAFIFTAVGVSIVAACLNLNLFRMTESPAGWLVFAGVTIVLIGAARLCAAIWRNDESGWETRL
jgi:hypothetical protein